MAQLKVFRHHGENVPCLACDTCGQRIDDGCLAAAVWKPMSQDGRTNPVFFVHKGKCHDRADASSGEKLPWIELALHFALLMRNMGVTPERMAKALEHCLAFNDSFSSDTPKKPNPGAPR
jgi:hypothetical protein